MDKHAKRPRGNNHRTEGQPTQRPRQRAPSIDPFSAKNEPMSRRNVRMALSYVGLLDGGDSPPVVPFARRDGSPGRINRHVDVLQSGPPAPVDAPLVVQVSRWDYMKDMAGVMEAFAKHVDSALGAHLVLAGPAVTGGCGRPRGRRGVQRLCGPLACAAARHSRPRPPRVYADDRPR
jgi:trehalose synthase